MEGLSIDIPKALPGHTPPQKKKNKKLTNTCGSIWKNFDAMLGDHMARWFFKMGDDVKDIVF